MKNLHIMILVIMLVAIAIIVDCSLLNVSHTPKIPPVSVLPGEGQPCPQGNCQKGLVCKSKNSDESGVTVCQYPTIKPNPPRPKRHHSPEIYERMSKTGKLKS